MKSLKDDLLLLNEIAKSEVDSDWDYESIIYIAVDFEETKNLIKKFLTNKNYTYEDYLKDYLEDETIDICGLWGELDQTYKTDTWFNMKKKEFYIPKWYHKIKAYYSVKKRNFKYILREVRGKYKFYKIDKKNDRELKKRLKMLSKYYGGK